MRRFGPGDPLRSVLLALTGVLLSSVPVSAQNPIQIENMLLGVNDWVIPAAQRVTHPNWSTTDRSNAEIEGYASLTSVAAGETIRFYVNTAEPEYQMRFYRIGWYGGSGAREMLKVDRDGVVQPDCDVEPMTDMVHCNWTDPGSLRRERERPVPGSHRERRRLLAALGDHARRPHAGMGRAR